MLHPVGLIRTDVSEERIASIISVTRIGKLETTLDVTSNHSTLRRNTVTQMMEVMRSSETSILTTGRRRDIPEDCILRKQVQFPKRNVF
jgi:hypothetical protein